MINAQQFLGLSEAEAQTLAVKAGLRVVVNSAAPSMLTNSMEMDRITLVVQGGFVTSAKVG
jgi:hypothetical protein